MKLYYAGPEHLAGPVVEDGQGPLVSENQVTVLLENVGGSQVGTKKYPESVLERCVRHHLRADTPVLFSNPARPLAAYQARLGRQSPDPAQVKAILQQCASELVAFMRLTAHPAYSGGAALFVRDPALLLGLGGLSYSVIPSLGAYLGYAPALGVACYVACEELDTLPRILSNVLERARAVVQDVSGPDFHQGIADMRDLALSRASALYEREPA